MPPKRKAAAAPASATVSLNDGASVTSSDDAVKRLRTMSYAIVKQYTCPISQEPIVDPVIAEDRSTYDREGIEQWLQTHTTSPLNPSFTLTLTIARLIPNRIARGSVETLVDSSELDEDACAA